MSNIIDEIHKAYKEGYEQGRFDGVMDATDGKAALKGYDVVAVIRCKNCKFREDGLYCRRIKDRPFITTNVDFCSNGELKE